MDVRKALFDHRGTKLLSLGLSLTLWLYVTSMGTTEQTLMVPVELRNVPQGMTVTGSVAGSIEVRVQGQERVLRDEIGRKMVALLDLSGLREGENIVRLSPYDINHPPGITVTHMSVSEIKVRLEPLVRKAFRLIPVLHGVPAAGYRVGSVTVTPPKVMIEGPASVMRTLQRLETMPIDIQSAKARIIVEPRIDYHGQQVTMLENDITVRVNIERAGK